jgi:sugar-specific transcriptional regulator TrmB
MIPSLLEQIGLNANEAKIYVASLELGPAHAGRIIHSTGMSRATVYDALERLAKKGLIAKSLKKGTTTYAPEDPDRLEYLLQSQKRALLRAEDALDRQMPQLKRLVNPHMRIPAVRFYEGIEGIQTVLNDSLSATEVIYGYVNADAMERIIKPINDLYLQERKKKHVRKKGLVLKTEFAQKLMKTYDREMTEARWLPDTTKMFHIEMNVYDGKVSYVTYREKYPIAVIIEDPDIYQIHRSTFESLWNAAEEIGK